MQSLKMWGHPTPPTLRVGGLTPFSTIDYPNALSAVVFCQGCPWRCRYCHNPALLPLHGIDELAWSAVVAFLNKRQGLLDAVVFSGGEPTLQTALLNAMQQVAAMGYQIGLHTAGCNPQHLAQVLPFVNWVGMDIKAPVSGYQAITGAKDSGLVAWESVKLVINSGVKHEFRLTLHPSLLTPTALEKVLITLKQLGASDLIVQRCRTSLIYDTTLPTSVDDMNAFQDVLNYANIVMR